MDERRSLQDTWSRRGEEEKHTPQGWDLGTLNAIRWSKFVQEDREARRQLKNHRISWSAARLGQAFREELQDGAFAWPGVGPKTPIEPSKPSDLEETVLGAPRAERGPTPSTLA